MTNVIPAKAGIQCCYSICSRFSLASQVLFIRLDSRLHPQGVRRGCKGLKPQQHTLRGNDGTG
jgi:hypothetical protein